MSLDSVPFIYQTKRRSCVHVMYCKKLSRRTGCRKTF